MTADGPLCLAPPEFYVEGCGGRGSQAEAKSGRGTGSPATQPAEAVEPCPISRPYAHRPSGSNRDGHGLVGGLVGAQGAVDDVGEPALRQRSASRLVLPSARLRS